jgi:hypothetical protein
LSPTDKAKFITYVRDAEQSPENLAFLLDNLGEKIELDYSVDSLAKAEAIYWRHVPKGIPEDLSDVEHFSQLLGQYLGQCIIQHTGGKWVQCDDQNPLFSQPCVDGFGGQDWDRVYPVDTARNLWSLPREKPNFPGVREHRVFAAKLEKALAIHAKKQTTK